MRIVILKRISHVILTPGGPSDQCAILPATGDGWAGDSLQGAQSSGRLRRAGRESRRRRCGPFERLAVKITTGHKGRSGSAIKNMEYRK